MNMLNQLKPFEQLSDIQLLDIATHMMNHLMDASTRQDYWAHIQDFLKRAQTPLDPTYFEQICTECQQRFGFFSHREFVALFRRPDSIAVI